MSTETQPMRQIRVRRTFLVERIQEWVVDVPAAYDTDEWKANDLGGFDQYVTDNGDLVAEDYEHVEYDDLDLHVVSTPAMTASAQSLGAAQADGSQNGDRLAAVREFHRHWGEQETDSLDVLDLWEQLGRLLGVTR
jgi:hypothetical protein